MVKVDYVKVNVCLCISCAVRYFEGGSDEEGPNSKKPKGEDEEEDEEDDPLDAFMMGIEVGTT